MLTWPRTIRGTDPPLRRSTPCSPHPPSPRRSSPGVTPGGCSRRQRSSCWRCRSSSGSTSCRRSRSSRRAGRLPSSCRRPRTDEYPSDVLTKQQRDAASARSCPGTTSPPRAPRPSPRSSCASSTPRSRPIDAAFADGVTPEGRGGHPQAGPARAQLRRSGRRSRASTRSAGTALRDRGGARPRDRRASRAARQPGRPDQRLDRGPHGRRPQRRRARARRGADRPAHRPQLVVLRRPHQPGEGARRRGRRAGHQELGEGRDDRPRRRPRGRRRVRGDRLLRRSTRAAWTWPGSSASSCCRARHRPAARLDLALPARVLASQQRPAAAEPAAAVRRVRAQADRRPGVAAVRAAAGRRRACWSRSCSTRAWR